MKNIQSYYFVFVTVGALGAIKYWQEHPIPINENSIPINEYRIPINNEPIDECCICLDRIENGEKLKILNCCHQFHADCINEWQNKNNRCPFCQ